MGDEEGMSDPEEGRYCSCLRKRMSSARTSRAPSRAVFLKCFQCSLCFVVVPSKETSFDSNFLTLQRPSTSRCHTKAQRAVSNRTRSSELHPLRLFRHPHPALARTNKCLVLSHFLSNRIEVISVHLFDVLLDLYS